jgi:hypothetical protein
MRAIDLVRNVSDLLSWGEVDTIEGEQSKEVRIIVRACELVMSSLQADKNWPELAKEGTLITQADQTHAVTAAFTQGSKEVSGSFFDTEVLDVVGCLVAVGDYETTYRVTYIDDTTMKLDREWVDEDYTGLAVSLTFGRDRYEVPRDFDRLRSDNLFNITTGDSYVEVVDEDELGMIMGSTLTPDSPTKVFLGGLSPSGKIMFNFDCVPDESELYRYKYQANHPELTLDATPILYPVRYHQAIVDLVVARLGRDMDNKALAQQQAGEALQEKVKQHSNPSTSETRLRLSPGGLRRKARRRY